MKLTSEEKLLLHKIQTGADDAILAKGITMAALRTLIERFQTEPADDAARAYEEGKEVGYEDGYANGRADMAREAKDLIDSL